MHWRPLAFTVLAGLTGCNPDVSVSALFPVIAVAPDALDYGEQTVPIPTSQELYISNGGRAPLTVHLELDETTSDVFTLPWTDAEIGAGETSTLLVGFQPSTYLPYTGNIVITSNDEQTPEVVVPLSGEGVDGPVPDIAVSPLTLEFTDVAFGGNAVAFLTVKNEGDAPLTLGHVEQTGSGAFVLSTDPSNAVIAGGGEVPVVITYTPTSSEDGDDGHLTFPSDDPDEPSTTVLLLGNGGSEIEYPVAAIDCPGTTAPPAWADLDASGSYDPEGFDPLSYAWTLDTTPPGSQGLMTNTVGDHTSVFTDAAGDYLVKLVVQNAIGTTSAPTACVLHAIPLDNVHVELTWDTPRADLDLHVLEDGAELFENPGDCNWCNKNPKWGQTGNTDDDPRLDLDDRAGYGPENINILDPAAGRYFVKVHYFDDNDDDLVVATVRVYVNGVEASKESKTLERNQVWDAMVINWPAGTVAVQTTPLYPASDRQCY